MLPHTIVDRAAQFAMFVFADNEPTISELLTQIEALEDRVTALEDSAAAQESGSEQKAELSYKQAVEDLTTHVWEGAENGEHMRITFDSDNKAGFKTVDTCGEEHEGEMTWALRGKDIIFVWEGEEWTAEYSKDSGGSVLIYNDPADDDLVFFLPNGK